MRNRPLATLALATLLVASGPALALRVQLTPAELMTLPKYCWARHVDAKYASMPGHTIPGVCGGGMNHLCTAHMYLIAAQRITDDPRTRRFHAQKAIDNFRYTQRAMTPECPLRPNVEMGITMTELLKKTIR